MSDDRRFLEPPEDDEPIVTYSRIEPRRPARQRQPRPARPPRPEPHIDAQEVPWSDPEPAVTPDMRAVPFDVADDGDVLGRGRTAPLPIDPLTPPRRGGRGLRLVLTAGIFALVAGAGILAVAFFTAGYGPRTAPAVTATGDDGGTTLATRTTTDPLAAGDADTDAAGPGVRAIPLGEEGAAAPAATPDAAAAPAAPPPVPRPRPERAVATVPDAAGEAVSPVVPATPGASAAVPPQPADDGDFIGRIEQTLANMPRAGAPSSLAPDMGPAPAAMSAPLPAAPPPSAVMGPDSTIQLTPASPAPVVTIAPQGGDNGWSVEEDAPALDWSTNAGQPPSADVGFPQPIDGGTVFTLDPPALSSGPIPPADIPNAPPSGFQ